MTMTGRARWLGRTTRRLLLGAGLLAALGTMPHASAAQANATRAARQSPDSVRLVVDLFFRAVADERWTAAAALVDTTEIQRLVAEQVRHRPERARREMTLDDFMRADPKKPRAVAEYELERYREQMASYDPGQMLSYEWYGVGSVDELRVMSAVEATVRYLQAQDFRMRLRELARRSKCADSAAVRANIPFSFHRILAAALASDTVAYVLHEDQRFSGGRPGASMDPTVMQLRFRNGGWRILPTRSLISESAISFGVVERCDSTGRRGAR